MELLVGFTVIASSFSNTDSIFGVAPETVQQTPALVLEALFDSPNEIQFFSFFVYLFSLTVRLVGNRSIYLYSRWSLMHGSIGAFADLFSSTAR